MIDLTVKEIAEIVGGRLDSVENSEALVTGFVDFADCTSCFQWLFLFQCSV